MDNKILVLVCAVILILAVIVSAFVFINPQEESSLTITSNATLYDGDNCTVKLTDENGIGIAKDKLGLRPGVMAETDDVFAIASEEVSLREVVDTQNIEQISPGEVMVYEI